LWPFEFLLLKNFCLVQLQGISLYSYPYLNQQKCFVFLIIYYVLSSTKLEKRAEQLLPGSGGRRQEGDRQEAGGRNGPNNVCTYE
jgi:hypothetical protein